LPEKLETLNYLESRCFGNIFDYLDSVSGVFLKSGKNKNLRHIFSKIFRK
jgi:hypothetical protein